MGGLSDLNIPKALGEVFTLLSRQNGIPSGWNAGWHIGGLPKDLLDGWMDKWVGGHTDGAEGGSVC